MLLAHKIELRPTPEQREYLDKACRNRRHCYNQLLEYFSQKDEAGQLINKWSKAAAYQYYIKVLRVKFPWYSEVSSRVTRNAIDDLDNAFKHFFRRCKNGEKPGYPRFKKRNKNDDHCHSDFFQCGILLGFRKHVLFKIHTQYLN